MIRMARPIRLRIFDAAAQRDGNTDGTGFKRIVGVKGNRFPDFGVAGSSSTSFEFLWSGGAAEGVCINLLYAGRYC